MVVEVSLKEKNVSIFDWKIVAIEEASCIDLVQEW